MRIESDVQNLLQIFILILFIERCTIMVKQSPFTTANSYEYIKSYMSLDTVSLVLSLF